MLETSGVKLFQESAKKLWGIDVSDEDAKRHQEMSAAFIEQHLAQESYLFRRFTELLEDA